MNEKTIYAINIMAFQLFYLQIRFLINYINKYIFKTQNM